MQTQSICEEINTLFNIFGVVCNSLSCECPLCIHQKLAWVEYLSDAQDNTQCSFPLPHAEVCEFMSKSGRALMDATMCLGDGINHIITNELVHFRFCS